jgi:hypothetical protein
MLFFTIGRTFKTFHAHYSRDIQVFYIRLPHLNVFSQLRDVGRKEESFSKVRSPGNGNSRELTPRRQESVAKLSLSQTIINTSYVRIISFYCPLETHSTQSTYRTLILFKFFLK